MMVLIAIVIVLYVLASILLLIGVIAEKENEIRESLVKCYCASIVGTTVMILCYFNL